MVKVCLPPEYLQQSHFKLYVLCHKLAVSHVHEPANTVHRRDFCDVMYVLPACAQVFSTSFSFTLLVQERPQTTSQVSQRHADDPSLAACQVHDKDFVARFSNGTLTETEMRRIGFGEVTRHPDLIERTKAEVAGEASCLGF